MARTVAYQGAPGAFAHEACRAFLPEWTPIPYPTFEAVAEAVRAGETERGMLPLRNSAVGDVPGVADLIRESGVLVLSRHRLPVRMHLLVVPGASFEGVKLVASHPVALAQCRKWLEREGLESVQEANTAVAARDLARSGDLAKAVIASDVAAEAYGLAILRRDIHDVADNATTFGILARAEEEGQ
jgi:prephenate dehydratase